MSALEVRTEAGHDLRRWLLSRARFAEGGSFDRETLARIAAIEAEAIATERARITREVEGKGTGWAMGQRAAFLAIVNGEASFDSPHDIAIKRGREM